MAKTISLVIPVLNEEDNIKVLAERIISGLESFEFEVLFVDDGSTDSTVERILQLNDPRFKAVELMKNFGQSSAMQAGIDAASGEYIITLDGDLQNDPSDIPMMIQVLEEKNVDLVAGERINRQDGMVIRKLPSKIANWIIRRTTEVRIRDYGCTLKVFRREIAKNLHLYGELHRFIPVLAHLQGARIVQVPVQHHARIHGKSKYGINRTFKVVSDLMLMLFLKKYLLKPMHLFGGIGMVILSIGLLINAYFVYLKIMGADIWGRPMLLLGILLVMGGIQVITIGILAEIQMRTYYESQNKTTYNIRKIHRHEA
ncbi:glycosyltransferase family 2 protein [bacterium]|nr:glycosyltransferase family 2 protein [bacterium]